MNIKILIRRLVLTKLLKTKSESEPKNTEQTTNKRQFEKDKTESNPPIAIHKELGKNKWLYPTDNHGKLERGRTLEN